MMLNSNYFETSNLNGTAVMQSIKKSIKFLKEQLRVI